MKRDAFGSRGTLDTGHGSAVIHRLEALSRGGLAPGLERLPFSIKVLLESVLRNVDDELVGEADVKRLAAWNASAPLDVELPFMPARVILQDFTGVPAVVDLASMRGAMKRLSGDPRKINPLVPVDLVVDHSVQVDVFGSPLALQKNAELEFQRNRERYEFLRWGQKAFASFRVVPPATGIVHQVNLEFLAKGVLLKQEDGEPVAMPDTLVGTDSHTTMINGLGVLGWGVGGIEAEAAMLGQPLYMVTPQVVGFKLTGRLREGVTATDLVLTVTQALRKKGVVEKFVEFFGPGLAQMSLADRATIANMAPEYGATCGFFPVDDETLRYLRRTGRSEPEVQLVERYTKEQGLFRTETTPDPVFSDTLELDLSMVEPSLAGPKRPQDRIALAQMKTAFRQALTAPVKDRGFGLAEGDLSRQAPVAVDGGKVSLGHGAVVIAAITSCTNTSNPSVMLGAGLLARKAVARGLKVPPYVKTSLAPGSKVVTEYLERTGLTIHLESLGFHTVGYGCTTCIGNSGPLPPAVSKAVNDGKLVASAVLSGNRNFEGRINPDVKANYLASPPLVVAYALAGTTDIDLTKDPIGKDPSGQPVMLSEIWPTQAEVATLEAEISGDMFRKSYGNVFDGNPTWNAVSVPEGDLFDFKEASTYIQDPPFFQGLTKEPAPLTDLAGARVLAVLGDSVTTDHISPAGDIAEQSPAGRFLKAHGVTKADFNSYGSRRGNDRVMVRGTFANIRLKNLMVPGVEGGVTLHQPSGEKMDIYDAAERYRGEGVPLVVIAGKEYGSGSSRDWAAKGTLLLGVRAVLAESYERIHRSNLVGMGVLPLQFKAGQNAESLGLTGRETLSIAGLSGGLKPRQEVTVQVARPDGTTGGFAAVARLDTPVEINYYRNGGILPTVLRKLIRELTAFVARLSFLGAARTVTGSQYLVEASGERLLVDSGMFQGPREVRQHNWDPPSFDPRSVKSMVLTHTHIDHVGRVPLMVKRGFEGRIYCTAPTRDLCEVLLLDAAHLQEEDANYLNRKGLSRHQPALPLFVESDVEDAMKLFETVPLHEERRLSPVYSFRLRDAGHLLGAASVELTVSEGGRQTRILFSGDVGRFETVLAHDPELATPADYLVVESTYGNRTHAAVPVKEQLLAALIRTFARGGVVLIPAFAVGRAQQMIVLMYALVTEGALRAFPIYLDSPMAVDATRIYSQYPDAHGVSLSGVGGRSILYNKWVTTARSRQESEALNQVKGPAVIISSSGMLTGGRILHHCRQRLPHAENTLLITGYQSENTMGRALLDGARFVRIHKSEVPVLAEVANLKGLSGHGDAGEMLRWLGAVSPPPRRVFLTHGEPDAAEALGAKIAKERGFDTYVPSLGEAIELN